MPQSPVKAKLRPVGAEAIVMHGVEHVVSLNMLW